MKFWQENSRSLVKHYQIAMPHQQNVYVSRNQGMHKLGIISSRLTMYFLNIGKLQPKLSLSLSLWKLPYYTSTNKTLTLS